MSSSHSSACDPLPDRTRQVAPPAPLIRRLVAFDHCKIPLPSFVFLRHDDPVSRLHRRVLEFEADAPRPASRAQQCLASIVWTLAGARAACTYLRSYGAFVRREHGVGFGRQLADLAYGVRRHNMFPRHYYWRKLFLLPSRRAWLDNLEHRQVNDLITDLNRSLPVQRLADKYQFFQHCRAHDLPTPPVLAAWKDGRRYDDAAPAPVALPAQDLFAKPLADFGSVGTLAFTYDDRGSYRHGSQSLSAAELLELLRVRSIGSGYILQLKLLNGGGWADYGTDDLCNLRIVTGRLPDGEPELVTSFLRMPSSHTTFGHDRHVLLSAVDIHTGRLGPGLFREIKKGRFDLHPDTSAPITGRIIPGWDKMVALTLRAHRTLPWMPFIGWDVVATADGVQLLEANPFWGADAAQLPGAVPLGQTPFPAIYWAWADRFSRA